MLQKVTVKKLILIIVCVCTGCISGSASNVCAFMRHLSLPLDVCQEDSLPADSLAPDNQEENYVFTDSLAPDNPGFGGVFNSATVPAKGYDGEQGGGLAISTGWSQTFVFYQTITLPAGTYTLNVPTYNGSADKTEATSQVAWVPQNGSAVRSNVNRYPTRQWTLDQITFTLTKTGTPASVYPALGTDYTAGYDGYTYPTPLSVTVTAAAVNAAEEVDGYVTITGTTVEKPVLRDYILLVTELHTKQ